MPENCVTTADITLISLFPSSTYNYFRFPSAILNLQVCRPKCQTRLAWVRRKKFANYNHWNLARHSLLTSLYSTWHTAGGNGEGLIDPLNLPSPLLSTYVMRDTCNKRVRPNKFTVPNSIAYSLYYSLFSLFETCERLDVTAWSKIWIMVK